MTVATRITFKSIPVLTLHIRKFLTISTDRSQKGSLAVPLGRELAKPINKLLSYPFAVKLASRDYHPPDHISFSTSHPPPNNISGTSWIDTTNPSNSAQLGRVQLWPPHCIEGTPGADIIPEIDQAKLQAIVRKGMDRRTEMFSCFGDMFGRSKAEGTADLDVAAYLKERKVTDVYVCGLTGDCCARDSALDSVARGFRTYLLRDCVKSEDEGQEGWGVARKLLEAKGVIVVESSDDAVQKVRKIGTRTGTI